MLTAFFTICFLFFLNLPAHSQPQNIDHFVDIQGLQNSGEDWQVTCQEINEASGRIALHHDKWLMYFLHWRPLTEKNKALTPEYVRNHMLNFWGEALNFELTHVEGELQICGHRALFTEGTLRKGAIHTRFIVWNCPETNRQFTADCNINLRRGTPPELLELQQQITKTVRCHKHARPHAPASMLSQKYESQTWDLSFYLPPNWRTSDFIPKEWYPNGMTKQNGSLWTLLTDSEKHLELLWEETDQNISSDLFNTFLARVSNYVTHSDESPKISNIQLSSLEKKTGYFIGTGVYQYKQYRKGKPQTFDYRFKGLLWRKGKHVYFLLAGLIEIKKFWGFKNDLTPSSRVLETFLKKEIIPSVKPCNVVY